MNQGSSIPKAIALLGIVIGFWGISLPPTKAVTLADGTVAFAKPPRLLDAITTFREVRFRGAKYYFTIVLPPDADEPLGKVTVNLRQGADQIDYRLEKTQATRETVSNKHQGIAIASTTFTPDTQTVTVIFAQPISPGTTFTFRLIPKRNPDLPGTYLFGVTAFPGGAKSQGIYLGVGRLQFDRSDYGGLSLY